MNALRKIHRALVTGGVVVDTQPISAHPPVRTDTADLGTLDMRAWAELIAAVDERVQQVCDDGLFENEIEQRVVVTDTFDNGMALFETVKDWQRTTVPAALQGCLAECRGPAMVDQEVRLRVLRRETREGSRSRAATDPIRT